METPAHSCRHTERSPTPEAGAIRALLLGAIRSFCPWQAGHPFAPLRPTESPGQSIRFPFPHRGKETATVVLSGCLSLPTYFQTVTFTHHPTESPGLRDHLVLRGESDPSTGMDRCFLPLQMQRTSLPLQMESRGLHARTREQAVLNTLHGTGRYG